MAEVFDELSEFEPQAQAIISKRYSALCDWMRQAFADHPAWCEDLLQPDQHRQLQAWLFRLNQDDMRSLAERLDLIPLAARTALRQCHQHGCFDRPKPRSARIDEPQPHDTEPVQPDRSTILPHVRALLRRIPDKHRRIDALVRQGFCRNKGNAQAVAALVEQSERNSDRGIVRECRREGHIPPQPDLPKQPDGDAIVQFIHSVFQRVLPTEQRAIALLQEGLCTTFASACVVVARFEERDARSGRYDYTIHKCLERGLFKKLPARPDVADVYQRIAAIFAAVADEAERVQMVLWSGICTRKQQAQQVVALLPGCTPQEQIVQQCWSAGFFDLMPPTEPALQSTQQPYAIRLPFHEVEQYVTLLCGDSKDAETQTRALIAVGCCRDENAARQVVDALDRRDPTSSVNRIAVSLAHRIRASYTEHGLIGLLAVSDYEPADLLFFIQRAVPYVTTTSDDPAATLAVLRRDLVALYRAFQQVDSTLWRRDLLDSPIVSENRTYCQRCIVPEQHAQIIAALQAQHDYPDDEATTIFTLLVERSGFGVIDWRCGVPFEQAGHAWEKQRLRRILEHHLGALKPEALNYIESQVHKLKEAMQESGVTVSLVQLLNSQPYSVFRRRLNRRLPLAYGQVQFFRRNDSWERRKHRHYRRHFRDYPQAFKDNPLAHASALVHRFSWDVKEDANRLYQVRTYGGIGFIPKDQWLSLIDTRLLALLKFYKFVRIEGRLNVPQAVQQVNHYAKQLGLTPLSAQLAKALNGAIAKPRRWNGGESDRTATVRKNANVVLPGTPWLHRVWRLFHIPLNLPIAASSFSAASETSHLLLVVDLGSQLPPGLWVSAHPPGIPEVGLALFQSIWHPGALDWPLRGAPEVLQVPASLLTPENETLTHAAEWLQMKVQVVPDVKQATTLKKLPILQALLDNLAFVGLDEIRRGNGGQPLTVKGVQDAVLGWIRTSEAGFTHHTPGLDDPVSVMYGLTTPAFHTPAAGFLLPMSGEAQTVNNGVLVDGRFYASADFSLAADQILTYRTFPYRYRGRTPDEGMPDAIYVEEQHGVLHYLVRHPNAS